MNPDSSYHLVRLPLYYHRHRKCLPQRKSFVRYHRVRGFSTIHGLKFKSRCRNATCVRKTANCNVKDGVKARVKCGAKRHQMLCRDACISGLRCDEINHSKP